MRATFTLLDIRLAFTRVAPLIAGAVCISIYDLAFTLLSSLNYS